MYKCSKCEFETEDKQAMAAHYKYKHKKTYEKSDKDRVMAMLEEGKTYNEINKETGVTLGVISRWRKEQKELRVKQKPEPQKIPTPIEVADALLQEVLNFLHEKQYMKEEIQSLKLAIVNQKELEKELAAAKAELERVLKIHNEQVKRGSYTTGEELIRLARIR